MRSRIIAYRTDAARSAPGVAAVIAGERHDRALRQPGGRRQGADRMLADRGRPGALCRRASGRRRRRRPLLAEDALDLIEVDYEPLPAVVDPWRRSTRRSRLLHDGLGGNLASERSFRYGDPEARLRRSARTRRR